MNKFILANQARLDLKEISRYHNKYSKSYSKILNKQIISSIKTLLDYSNFGKPFKQLRETRCGNYRIIYIKKENNIYIIRIVHSSMDFK